MLAAWSDDAIEQLADVVQATDAQGKAPELYLLLLFAGLIISLVVLLMLRYAKETHSSFVAYVQNHENAEDKRMQTMENMANACHAQATKHIELVGGVANRCEAALRGKPNQ